MNIKEFPMVLHKIMERVNQESRPFEDLKEKYGNYERDSLKLEIVYMNNKEISKELQKWCFKLLEKNISGYYLCSSLGWQPKEKKNDMNKNWAKFLIARDSRTKIPIAFTFFRFDIDYNRAAIYCYELHVEEEFQGKGIGSHLMKCLEQIVIKWNLEIVILTALTNNEKALKFYEKLGYERDETSPKDRLRKIAPYRILSKKL